MRALSQVRPSVFDAGAVEALTRIATDAVEARDVSVGSLSSLRILARRVLVHHARSGDGDLPAWGLTVMEQVEGTTGVDFERLDRGLRRGQERAVVDVLTPWVRRGMTRRDYRRALALARSLGRRAYAMADVQEWIAEAIWRSTSGMANTAIPLWLADPAHRDERVGRLVAWDPTTANLHQVSNHLARRRTDLLDPYLTGDVIPGKFVAKGARWFPAFRIEDTACWLPRQREQYALLLTKGANDDGANAWKRTDAIRRCAQLGTAGEQTVRRYLESSNVPLAEAALGALVWLPSPAAAIPTLLEHADSDRARVAVYAMTRAAH